LLTHFKIIDSTQFVFLKQRDDGLSDIFRILLTTGLTYLLTYLSSWSQEGNKESNVCIHCTLSVGIRRALPRDSPISLSSLVMVHLHVFIGRPCCLLTGGVHRSATCIWFILTHMEWSLIKCTGCLWANDGCKLILNMHCIHRSCVHICLPPISSQPYSHVVWETVKYKV